MTKKKLVIIFAVIVLLILSGAIFFYFKPTTQEPEPIDPFSLLVFEPKKDDLTEFEIDKFSGELESVKTSVAEMPDQLDAWLHLGVIHKNIGDYERAEQAWLYVNEIRPRNSTSFGNLADLYANFTQEYDKAILMYRKAIENSLGEDKNVNFYRNLYYLYLYNLEDLEKAEDILFESISHNPNHFDPVVLLASFYSDQGQTDKAIEYYQKALELKPDSEAVKREIDRLTNQ